MIKLTAKQRQELKAAGCTCVSSIQQRTRNT